jgi:hypothetical protein
MSADKEKALKPVCNVCGGGNILFDAYAVWEVGKQDYTLSGFIADKPVYCEHCDREVSINWVEVSP